MFRCISGLRGLVFDMDSFEDTDIEGIVSLFSNFSLLFMTSSESMKAKLSQSVGVNKILLVEGFQSFLSPNKATHSKALILLGIHATELIYVSRRIGFLKNAMGFIGGTVWIVDSISYEAASTAPDLICRDLSTLAKLLDQGINGFFGEVGVFPHTGKKVGLIIPVDFETEYGTVPLYMIGRYFGYTHYMNQLHPYSTAIFWNKKEGGKAFGSYNGVFENLFCKTMRIVQQNNHIDAICSIPPRPGRIDRFSSILDGISSECGLENLESNFKCIRDYPTQKGLSYSERQQNIRGVFCFDGDLAGKNVAIIDDVVSTGATIREAISVLKKAGANEISIIALAVNQPNQSYWSSNTVEVACPNCGEKMRLLVNSKNQSFFYSCYNCRATKNFSAGRQWIENYVNLEFAQSDDSQNDLM